MDLHRLLRVLRPNHGLVVFAPMSTNILQEFLKGVGCEGGFPEIIRIKIIFSLAPPGVNFRALEYIQRRVMARWENGEAFQRDK